MICPAIASEVIDIFIHHKMIAEKKIQSINKENTTKLNTIMTHGG